MLQCHDGVPFSLLNNSLKTMMSEELFEFISNYKFAIAFENAICEDYITEKLWRPLIAGSLPLYIGSPSVKDWLPNERSAIFPLDFSSPRALAEFLLHLNANDSAYSAYMSHKLNREISNVNLVNNFTRIWNDDDWGIIDKFECLLCDKSAQGGINIVDVRHYDCPKPVSILGSKRNDSNWWHFDYDLSKCEADLLTTTVVNGDENAIKNFKFDPVSQHCNLSL